MDWLLNPFVGYGIAALVLAIGIFAFWPRKKVAAKTHRSFVNQGQEIDDNTASKLMYLTQFFRRQGNPLFGKGVDPRILIERAKYFLGDVPRELTPRLYDILDQCRASGQLPDLPLSPIEDTARQRDLENWARYRQQLQKA